MTIRRRRLALAGVLIVLAGLGVAWRVVRREEAKYVKRDPKHRVVRLPVVRTHVGRGARLDWLLEPGAPDRRVAGIVLDERGPLAGVRVELRSELTREAVVAAPGVMSGADGRFDLGGQLPARWLLVATAEGKTPVVRPLDLRDPAPDGPHDRIVVRMGACLAALEGRVHDIDGKPLAGALVSETRRGVWWFVPVREMVTDSQGRFRICGIGSVTTVTAVSLDGYAPVRLSRIPPVTGWDVTMVPGFRVAGQVRTRDGAPIDGALVVLTWGGGLGPFSHNALSDADGQFAFASVGTGEYTVAADRTGYHYDGSATVRVTGVDVTGVVVNMKLCPRRVAGRVMASGQPIAGAQVVLGHTHPTQEDGSFVMPCVPAEVADIEVFGWDIVGGHTLPAGDQDIDDLVIEVARRSEITGVVSVGGMPVAGAQVWLRDPAAGPRLGWVPYEKNEVVTDEAGRYRLRPARGSYLLMASDPSTGARSAEIAIDIGASSQSEQVDLSLDVVATVDGVLVDSESRPVPGAIVVLSEGGQRSLFTSRDPFRTATTSVDGSFVFRGVLPGSYQVELDGWPAEDVAHLPRVEVQGADTRVTLRLQLRKRAGLTIAGRVVDDLGAPVALATVKSNRSATLSNRQGAFTLPSVVDGDNWISVRSPAGGRSGELHATGGNQDLLVVVPRTGAIEVTVTGFATGARLVALDEGEHILRDQELTGTSVVFEGLPPDTYILEAKDEQRVASAQVVVEAGKTVRATLSAGAGGTVRGVAVDADSGVPVGEASCAAGTAHAMTDAAGAFVLTNVPAGRIDVSCTKMSKTMDDMRMGVPVTVEVRAGGVVDGVEVPMRRVPPELRP